MLPFRYSNDFLFIAAISVLVLSLFLIYSTSFSAPFTFDDEYSLQGLAHIQNLPSALIYILSGDTGPSGRPLALLSFVLTASSWPDTPADFRYVNALIHIINALLVCLLAMRILVFMEQRPLVKYQWIALICAGLWGTLPLLASTSISIVQRMTSLSASFVLIGLWLYVIGRSQLQHRPRQGLCLMTLGIGAGTILSVLSKENGALLALYAGVLEFTLFRKKLKISSKPVNFLAKSLLIIPISALAFFLIWPFFVGGYEEGYIHRSFTMAQRLYTESIILWDYLINA
ncbi:MAG: hypothetical protein GY954_15020, partial [Alteromonas sp.]|nr:hypothetical protein [Alteromonas sp.]